MPDFPTDPEQWADCAPYLDGVRLFNERQYWEAHEAWELLWLEVDGVQSDYLQGLIQSAAALLKFSIGHVSPAWDLYHTAKEKLDGAPDTYMGLDVRAYQRQLAECFGPVLHNTGAALDAAKIPTIELM